MILYTGSLSTEDADPPAQSGNDVHLVVKRFSWSRVCLHVLADRLGRVAVIVTALIWRSWGSSNAERTSMYQSAEKLLFCRLVWDIR
jgi:hypothetical protein